MIKYKAVAILVLSLFLLVCSKTKNPVKNPSNPQFESLQSDCKFTSKERMGRVTENDTVIFSSHGDTILVTHQDAYYNCCAEIKVNIIETPDGFDLLEYDVGDACDCLCYFDITTVISGLSPSSYLIRYFDIDSNLVDSGVVDIPPKYTGFGSSQSKCKEGLYKRDAEATPDTLEDSVLVWSHGDTAWVTHKNAFYNCCLKIKVRIIPTPQGFDLYEYEEVGDLCNCMCYFDITTTIYGLFPGVYLIRVFDTAGNLVDEVELVIPPK
jgi:hypothetical protein